MLCAGIKILHVGGWAKMVLRGLPYMGGRVDKKVSYQEEGGVGLTPGTALICVTENRMIKSSS